MTAQAHPHVWIVYKTRVIAGKDGITAIELDWLFDKMFTEMAFDAAGVKKKKLFDDKDNAALQDKAFSNLKEYHYFVFLTADGTNVEPQGVENFKARTDNGQLDYTFTIKLPKPARSVSFQQYDPTFYVDVSPLMKRAPEDKNKKKGSMMQEENWVEDEKFLATGGVDGAAPPDCTYNRGKGIASVWGILFPTVVTCKVK
jgi:ABC-type uncharacterized transport system substrate-binding protein